MLAQPENVDFAIRASGIFAPIGFEKRPGHTRLRMKPEVNLPLCYGDDFCLELRSAQ